METRMLHLRLRVESVTAIQRRAGAAGVTPGDYIERVLWYSSITEIDCEGSQAGQQMDHEELYYATPLTAQLREYLAARSAAEAQNLASYSGALVEGYLGQFERDPGDLRLGAGLGELLSYGDAPAEEELLEVLRLVEGTPVSRMSEAYQARWLHQRISPVLRQIRSEGTPTELTLDRVRLLLGRLKAGGEQAGDA